MTTRTRQRGSFTTHKVVVTDYNPGMYPGTPSGTTTHTDVNRRAFSDVASISDTVIPNFRKRKAQGEVFMNNVTITRQANTYPTDEVVVIGPNIPTWGTRKFTGTFTAGLAANTVDPSWFLSRINDGKAWTLQEAYSKVAQEEFMSLVTVAEAGKTASMLSHPFKRADDLLTKIYTRKAQMVKKGVVATVAASSAWLEYRFGWKPLLYDIQGIWSAYTQNTLHYDKPVRLVARRSMEVEHNELNTPYTGSASYVGGINMLRNKTMKSKVSSGVLYELLDENLEAANARRMGLRLSDVPASLWELTPWSFIVDRFVSVGSWLNAITPKPGVTVKGSWTTEVRNVSLKCERLNTPMVIAGSSIVVPGGVSGSESTYVLTRVANPPMSTFAVPSWNPKDLSFNQTLDHIALIIQRLHGIGLK